MGRVTDVDAIDQTERRKQEIDDYELARSLQVGLRVRSKMLDCRVYPMES